MRARRIIGSLLATTLAASTMGVIATATPATAADTVQTRIVSGSSSRPVISAYSKPIEYGDSVSISVGVQAFVDGAWKDIYNGSVRVVQRVAGKSTTVASNSSAYVFDSTPARGNAVYTVSYTGGTGEYPEVNYAPTSATYSLKGVTRKLNYQEVPGNKTGIKGKMVPGGKAKITVLKKQGKKFKKFKKLSTSKSGRFTVVLPAPRKGQWHWKIIFAGNKTFSASIVKGSTYRR